MTTYYVHGMHGLGDNIHQRALIRKFLGDGNEVWLETPWPSIYHDLVCTNLNLVNIGSPLRTQAANARREIALFSSVPVPNKHLTMPVWYSPQDVRRCGSVLSAMLSSTVGSCDDADFRMPIKSDWHCSIETDKPIVIYRPLVERTEWSGCSTRNPDFEAYSELFHTIRKDFFVVSIADLADRKEWIVGNNVHADMVLHKGELNVGQLAALFAKAALVYCSPGFSVPLAQAVGTPVVCVFGGYENSKSFSYGANFAPYLGIDPINPCDCFLHGHACDKRIDYWNSRRRLEKFVNDFAKH